MVSIMYKYHLEMDFKKTQKTPYTNTTTHQHTVYLKSSY